MTEKKWYVVHALTGHEEKVKSTLERLINAEGLEDKFGEILIPKEEVIQIRKNKKKTTERKYFPGYVFVEMVIDNTTYWTVRNIPGVSGFLGDVNPIPLKDEEVQQIKTLMVREPSAKPRPAITYQKDETVRIIEGPFENFIGVVNGVDEEKSKLKVMVTIFGRATPVEVDFLQVEKI